MSIVLDYSKILSSVFDIPIDDHTALMETSCGAMVEDEVDKSQKLETFVTKHIHRQMISKMVALLSTVGINLKKPLQLCIGAFYSHVYRQSINAKKLSC